jgi:hypothetical protein
MSLAQPQISDTHCLEALWDILKTRSMKTLRGSCFRHLVPENGQYSGKGRHAACILILGFSSIRQTFARFTSRNFEVNLKLMPLQAYLEFSSRVSARPASQLCLIPCSAFYEPSYESGKAVWWRISMADGKPFAIAGLWRAWDEPDGLALSFTMLTSTRIPIRS